MKVDEWKLEIDQTSLRETLALVEQIEAAATRAGAALASLVVAPRMGLVGYSGAEMELIAGELVPDETPGLILAELKEQTALLRELLQLAQCVGLLTRSL